jgi:hypothetical protein
MFDETGACGVQWILRMEKLAEALTIMLLNHGADPAYLKEQWDTFGRNHTTSAGHANINKKRKHKDHRSYYDDHLREIATTRFQPELMLYRYDFDGPTDSSAIVEIPNHWGPLISDPGSESLGIMNR